ncbi:HutD family protein [Bdellovibrio bacteriovorus]|uniref:HutD/Ves family protein n=1 Tax=Bdellovibrio bacteriovorus TaxID=959 RepID=UPI0035A99C84
MDAKLIKSTSYQIMPWKNGLGSTAQIDIFPPGEAFPGEEFLWRVSSATVKTSSPFSNFPGCDRWLVVWKGEGLFLNDQKLSPIKPLAFSGETPIESRLVKGEVLDLGIIYRRDRISAELTVQEIKAGKSLKVLLESGTHYLFAATGEFSALEQSVGTGDTLKIQGGGELELSSVSGAQYFFISVRDKA